MKRKMLMEIFTDIHWLALVSVFCMLVAMWSIACGKYGLPPIDEAQILRQSWAQYESLCPEFMYDKNKEQ